MRIRNKIIDWKSKKKSQKLISLLKVFLMIFGIGITFFSIFLSNSLVSIFDNIRIPNGEIEFNLDFSNYSKIGDVYIKVPYSISNEGNLDIYQIKIEVSVDISYRIGYSHNKTLKSIFFKQLCIGICRVGEKKVNIFEGTYLDLNTTALGVYLSDINYIQEETRTINIDFSGILAGLIFFQFHLGDVI